jgi:hypothetical protein
VPTVQTGRTDYKSARARKIILVILLLCNCLWLSAQKKIELQPHKPYSMEVRLYDNAKTDDNFLMSLPITLNITDKNILMIMLGNDNVLDGEYSVWLFSEETELAELMKKNRNVSATKSFKNKNTTLNKVLPFHKKLILYRPFDDGYETVKKNTKPLFLELLNPVPNESLKFYLQFYLTAPDKKSPYSFIAKCKPIEIEIIIKK